MEQQFLNFQINIVHFRDTLKLRSHQRLKFVTNTFRLQPSVTNIEVTLASY